MVSLTFVCLFFLFLSQTRDIDLKKAPYLRADAARRNRRKTQELMKQITRDVLAAPTSAVPQSGWTEVHF